MTESAAKENLKVLLVDDDADVHFLVKEYLKERKDTFQVESVSEMPAAFDAVRDRRPDIIILDLSIDGTQGLVTFDRFRERVKDVPIVIFTSLDDESAALAAVNKGAQDYLVKGHVTPRMLAQVLLYSVERFRTQENARNPRLIDNVTGLSNEEGFAVFAEQFLRSLSRNMNGTVVFLFVLERLKEIESQFGVGEAHHALKTTTEILRESFRASDIFARLGDDQFVVLPASSSPFLSRTVMSRIKSSQTYYNARFNLYRIMLRWETIRFPGDENLSLKSFLTKIKDAFAKYESTMQAATE